MPITETSRRIVQIAVQSPAVSAEGQETFYPAIYALADDGTLWRNAEPASEGEWQPLPPLPLREES